LHVHLLDLTRAAHTAMDPVAPEISADGVGEVLDTFMPRLALRDIYPDLVAPLAVVTTDVDLAWVLSPRSAADDAAATAADRLPRLLGPLGDDHELPPDQVRGPAGRVLEVLWKRGESGVLDLRGDGERVTRYLASQLTP
jgi:hypothetical protein